ncbi:ankyrin repeat-containing domain protein [Mycena galopus ATCC 62051]|nr:ankyrin repeat-containing domain protein [Mycena galopus ATCC 62051]
MAVFPDLPPELLLHITSYLTRETIIDPYNHLAKMPLRGELVQVPDLPSISALSRTNVVLHNTLDRTLYALCASVEALGKLALFFAIEHQLESTLDKLVATGLRLDGDFNFNLKYGTLPTHGSLLHLAAAMRRPAMVANFIIRLLAPIPPPSTAVRNPPPAALSRRYYLSTALITAVVWSENTETSQSLILEGADVNFLDDNLAGAAPLYYAAATRKLELVRFLLASGADPNMHNNDTSIPVFAAVRGKNMAIVQALVDGGADIHVRDCELRNVLAHCTSIKLLRFFLERGVDPNNEDEVGGTALHTVCGADHADYEKNFVRLLCEFGAAPDKPNQNGETAVDLAMNNGLTEVVDLLELSVRNPGQRARIAEWWEERKRMMELAMGRYR